MLDYIDTGAAVSSMVHLEAVHGENQAALLSDPETKCTDVSFVNVGMATKLRLVGGYSGPLVGTNIRTPVSKAEIQS